jgi:RNA polymerase sigma-70 factor, ECF subfamily
MIEVEDRTKESFQRLVAAELPGLYSLARRLVRAGAEDMVQEALLRAYRSFATLREDPAAGRWLKRILVNVFRDELRKQARSVEELPVEQVEDFSLYRTLVEQDPLPDSDTLHHDFLQLRGILASNQAEEIPPETKARLQRFAADLEEGRWRRT